ncbi:hypothetical protein MCNF_14540 [Mycolicibacterium confluentis]|uniref:Uncharacterized protein n=1 Tax=Mycolicibacterium confluentis TaxID=28047 RepID=A0A7I7XUA5_9MYCO|nr:hypothetical protein MCNF_14540 [Mycolicibacterium confluentis]
MAVFGDPAVTELDDLVEVVAGVDVQHRKRQGRRPKGLLGQAKQDNRVLAGREQQHGLGELGGNLADDVHGFGFQQPQLVDVDVFWGEFYRGHSGSPSRSASAR